MTRKEIFEFEDFNWLPRFIRNGITNLIKVFHTMMGTPELISSLIIDLAKKTKFENIVDLGSGSGGPMLDVIRHINKMSGTRPMRLTLTDINPNTSLVEEVNALNNESIFYQEKPVDAIDIKQTPSGLKTMIASFHHMGPKTAKKILTSAYESKEPLLIYELAKNNIPFFIWCLFLPISLLILIFMSMVMTFFIRPLTLKQLIFTFIIPIIPIIYAWDGQASLMRTYTFNDIELLIHGLDDNNYTWVIDDATNDKGKKVGYYIMGFPTLK